MLMVTDSGGVWGVIADWRRDIKNRYSASNLELNHHLRVRKGCCAGSCSRLLPSGILFGGNTLFRGGPPRRSAGSQLLICEASAAAIEFAVGEALVNLIEGLVNRVVKLLRRQTQSAPLGPPRITISFKVILDYAGCSSFFASGFSATGPCVSALGGGGASPIRLE